MYTMYKMYLTYKMYTMYTMYMTLEEAQKRYREAMGIAEENILKSLPRYRTVGGKKYVIHTQADGSEKVFDTVTGKEIIEGEVV